jgi:Na+/melibiose symporter-like transporter
MAIGFLLMWVVFVLLVNHLARENKHRIGWTVAAGWFGIVTLFVFLIVESINHKRLEKLDAAGGKISGGQLRS